MRKKASRRQAGHHVTRASRKSQPHYWVVVHGWMFMVAFALMLGMGAILGNFFRAQLDATTPQVAGAQIEVK